MPNTVYEMLSRGTQYLLIVSDRGARKVWT